MLTSLLLEGLLSPKFISSAVGVAITFIRIHVISELLSESEIGCESVVEIGAFDSSKSKGQIFQLVVDITSLLLHYFTMAV